jgi:hypothetical protein
MAVVIIYLCDIAIKDLEDCSERPGQQPSASRVRGGVRGGIYEGWIGGEGEAYC